LESAVVAGNSSMHSNDDERNNDENRASNQSQSAGVVAGVVQNAIETAITSSSTIDSTNQDDAPLKNPLGIMTSEVGTPYYVAPEVLCHEEYNVKCDVYSAGVMAYLCLTGKLPVQGKDERETVKLLMNPDNEIDFSDELWEKNTQRPLSKDAKEFCQALLQWNPSNRPTAMEALRLEWMTKNVGPPPPLPPPLGDDKKEIENLPCLAKLERVTSRDLDRVPSGVQEENGGCFTNWDKLC